jgi:hypothetical protein
VFASGVVPGGAPPAPRLPAANSAALPRPAWLSRAAAAASAPGASVSVVLASAAHIEDSTSRSYAAALARFDAAQRPGLAPHVRIVDLDQRQLEPRVLAFMDALAAASATGKFGGAVALFASALRHALELAGRPEANPFLLTRVAWRKRALCKLSRKFADARAHAASMSDDQGRTLVGLSTVTRKTARLDRLADYHAVAGSVADACWANRSKRRIARAAFGVWSRSQGFIDGFFSRLLAGTARGGARRTAEEQRRTVLGFGDGKWLGRAPIGRCRESAERIFRRAGATVLHIDEFMTSKRCRVCGDDLQDVVDSENNKKRARPAGAACRDLKRCSRTSCSSLLDRDANVSRGAEGGEEGGEEGGGEEVPILTPPHTTHPADHTQAGLSLLQKTLCRVRGIEEPKHLRRDFVRVTETTRTPHGSERTARAGCSTFFLTARRKFSA